MKKLLLIDDDPLITTIYEKHFFDAGFEVRVANDGHQALNAVHEFIPDAVLLDLNMPDFNGIQWLQQVRRDARFTQLPVMVFTAGTINWQIDAANNSNVNFMFKEGAVPADVVDAIKGSLGMANTQFPRTAL